VRDAVELNDVEIYCRSAIVKVGYDSIIAPDLEIFDKDFNCQNEGAYTYDAGFSSDRPIY